MPIPTTLEQQFSSLSTEDTPPPKAADGTNTVAALVTPTKEDFRHGETDSLTSEDSLESPSPSPSPSNFLIQKTEHKLKEERGELAEEPLLKENPHRFVIFPIQDNDVRAERGNDTART
jgi:hypothetical protein